MGSRKWLYYDHCLALSASQSVLIVILSLSCYMECQNCIMIYVFKVVNMDLSKSIHGFLIVVRWIWQNRYIDFSKLLHGFVKIVTWIFFRLFYLFLTLCQINQAEVWPKISKFVKGRKVHKTLTNPFYLSIWVKIFNQIPNLMSYLKHRKNCECCLGHYL